MELNIATGKEHKVAEAKYDERLQLRINVDTEAKGLIEKKFRVAVLEE